MRGGKRGSESIPPAYVTTVISGSEMPWENLQNPYDVSIHRVVLTNPFQPSHLGKTILRWHWGSKLPKFMKSVSGRAGTITQGFKILACASFGGLIRRPKLLSETQNGSNHTKKACIQARTKSVLRPINKQKSHTYTITPRPTQRYAHTVTHT